jgi:hypothetical protein
VKVGNSSVVGDPTDESVSETERSVGEIGGVDSGVDSGGELGTVGIEPEGSRCVVREGVVMRRGSPSAALLFTSCLVSKGVVIDGLRDSLAVILRHCRCQKKSERLPSLASLTDRMTDRTIVSLLHGVRVSL